MNKIFKMVLSGALTTALALGGMGTAAFANAVQPDYSSFTVSKTFGDNMVVQRNEQFRVWGTADSSLDGHLVFVEFMDEEAKGVISNGEWCVEYPKALKENTVGSDMVVTCGTKEITIKNVLVGDVYMAVGQSNIAYTFNEAVTNSPEGYGGKDTVPSESDIIRICNNGLVYQNAYPAQGSDECRNIVQKGECQKTIGAFCPCILPVHFTGTMHCRFCLCISVPLSLSPCEALPFARCNIAGFAV